MVKNQEILNLSFGLLGKIEVSNPWTCFHRHNEVELCYFSGGTVVYRYGGSIVVVPPETVLLFWGSIPHQLIDVPEGTKQYWVTIPINQFLQWELPEDIVRRVLNGEMLKETGGEHQRTDALNFRYLSEQTNTIDAEMRKITSLIIEARVRQFIRRIREQGGAPALHGRNAAFRDKSIFSDLYKLIVESFMKQVCIKYYADKLGVNQNYAGTVFRQKCGITIVDFITLLRIHEAQKLLITTERKIIDIALDSGFGSVSNFYSAFNRICGMSPSEYRRSLR